MSTLIILWMTFCKQSILAIDIHYDKQNLCIVIKTDKDMLNVCLRFCSQKQDNLSLY